jgi:hypothetical protein
VRRANVRQAADFAACKYHLIFIYQILLGFSRIVDVARIMHIDGMQTLAAQWFLIGRRSGTYESQRL